MQITHEKIAELRRLLEKATPGPYEGRFLSRVYAVARRFADLEGIIFGVPAAQDWHDCELMAEAVNALPALLDRVAELERDLASEKVFSQNQVNVGLKLQDKLHALSTTAAGEG